MEIRWYHFIAAFFITASTIIDAGAGYLENFRVISDTTFAPSDIVYDMSIEKSANITNMGNISGFVEVRSGLDVYIQNLGNIDATFYIPNTSRITQVIKDKKDINPILGATNNFQIMVQNEEKIAWKDLQDISIWADKIVLNNSVLDLSSKLSAVTVVDNVFSPEIELRGNNVLYIDDVSEFSDKPLLSNISGEGTVNINVSEQNPLYRVSSYIKNNELFVTLVRETDYLRILGDNKGSFLNNLRETNPNDKLLSVLDAAESIDDINKIMARSIRLNPINLMDSVVVFNSFVINDFSKNLDGFVITPLFVYSDDFYISGVTVDAAYRIADKLTIGATGYAAESEFVNDMDEYNSVLYGGNVRIEYIDKLLLARMMFGMTQSDFDIGAVFDGISTVVDPSGSSLYSVADFGFNFNVGDNFRISPFVRAGFDSIKIIGCSDKNVFTGIGTDISLNAGIYDIEYKYGLNFSAYTNGTVNAAFRIGVISIADKAGGNIDVGLVLNEFGEYSYKVSAGVNFKF